jgi:ethanolamine utilization microcompartment shell protein EutL
MVILMEALEVVLGKAVVELVRPPMEATMMVVAEMVELVYG